MSSVVYCLHAFGDAIDVVESTLIDECRLCPGSLFECRICICGEKSTLNTDFQYLMLISCHLATDLIVFYNRTEIQSRSNSIN